MRDFFRNTPGFGDQPDNRAEPGIPVQVFEQRWDTIHRALLDYLRGDEAARALVRNHIVVMNAAEQSLIFGRIESVLEALPVPNSQPQARAAFALAEMSYGILNDSGARLFQKAEHFAGDCEDVPLQREAMLRRAALYYESEDSPSNLARAREIVKDACRLGTTDAPRDFVQFMRAYTIMGKCYLAEACGSVEKEALDVVAALESHYNNNREEVLALIRRAEVTDEADYKAIINAEIFVAEILSDEADLDDIRGHYESLLGIISAGRPLSTWGEAAILCSYAKTVRLSCQRGFDEVPAPAWVRTVYEEALGVIRDARIVVEDETRCFHDTVLYGQILHEEGLILYESRDVEAAYKSLCKARDTLMSLAETDPYVLILIEQVCECVDMCVEDLQSKDGNDGTYDPDDSRGAD